MTDIAEEIIEGCVYHTITVEGPKRFKVEVYRDGFMRLSDDFDYEADFEDAFFGGTKVATLYRSTEHLAHKAGIEYSFVTAGPEKFRGVTGPKYGRPIPR